MVFLVYMRKINAFYVIVHWTKHVIGRDLPPQLYFYHMVIRSIGFCFLFIPYLWYANRDLARRTMECLELINSGFLSGFSIVVILTVEVSYGKSKCISTGWTCWSETWGTKRPQRSHAYFFILQHDHFAHLGVLLWADLYTLDFFFFFVLKLAKMKFIKS